MNTLSSKHLFFVILGVALVSLETYPSVYVTLGGRDSWIGMLAASFIFFFFALYVMNGIKNTNCYDIKEIHTKAYGKIIGKIMLLLYSIMLLITAIECATVEANALHTNVFIETPIWYILLFFIVPAIYPIKKGEVAIILTTIVTVVMVYITGVIILILGIKYNHYNYLKPILSQGIVPGLMKCSLELLGLFGSLFIILPYLTVIREKQKVNRYVAIALIVVILMSIASIISLLATFGPERTSNIFYPRSVQTQLFYYGGYLEFSELFIILQTVASWFIKYILCLYAFILIYKNYFNNRKFMIYILSLFIFIASFLLSKNNVILFKLLNYYANISLVGFIILPFITFTLLRIRGKKGGKSTSKNKV